MKRAIPRCQGVRRSIRLPGTPEARGHPAASARTQEPATIPPDIGVRQPQLPVRRLGSLSRAGAALPWQQALQPCGPAQRSADGESGGRARGRACPAHGQAGWPGDLALCRRDTGFTARQRVSWKSQRSFSKLNAAETLLPSRLCRTSREDRACREGNAQHQERMPPANKHGAAHCRSPRGLQPAPRQPCQALLAACSSPRDGRSCFRFCSHKRC